MFPLVAVLAQADRLTETQVNAKLNVPIFLPISNLGRPMMTAIDGTPAVMIFFRKNDSDAALKAAGLDKGTTPGRTQVGTLSDMQNLRGALPFYVPLESELPKALEVGKTKTLQNTVMFYVADAKGGFVTMTHDQKTITPFFFAWADADKFLKDATDGKVAKPEIKLTTLIQLIDMIKTKPAKEAAQIALIPHRGAVEDVKAMTGG